MIDPDEILGQIRMLIDENPGDTTHYPELADRVHVLDIYLTNGGRLPRSWRQAHRPTMAIIRPSTLAIAVPDDEPEPLGPPNPADGELPDRDDDYTPEAINRSGDQ